MFHSRYLIFSGIAFLILAGVLFISRYEREEEGYIIVNGVYKFAIPSGGEGTAEEEEEKKKKYQWLEEMHGGVDWKKIEENNLKRAYENRLELLKQKSKSKLSATYESFGGGAVTGYWNERGSANQAGSIIVTDVYLPTQSVYCISDAGCLFKGNLNGSSWAPLADGLRFNTNVLEVVPLASGKRIVAASSGGVIKYSTDDGQTWTNSTVNQTDYYFSPEQIILLNDNTTMYLLATRYNYSPGWMRMASIYKSTDGGVTFNHIQNFTGGNVDYVHLWAPYNSSEVFVLANNSGNTLYSAGIASASLTSLSTTATFAVNTAKYMTGTSISGTTTIYVSTNANAIYKTTDNGVNWSYQGTTPAGGFRAGLSCAIKNASRLFFGDVDLYKSANSGGSWTLQNGWAQYYSNTDRIHADIMSITPYLDASNNEFTLIANHGGVHVSYDDFASTQNIGKLKLNVSQYYSIYTRQSTGGIIAGAQDQGIQACYNDSNTVLGFNQYLSGDYGHIVSSDNGASLWYSYPGDAVYQPDFNSSTMIWWSAPGGSNMGYPNSTWIYQFMPSPYSATEAFLAGGSVTATGSYIIRLQYSAGSITATNRTFNFKAASGGSGYISAMDYAQGNTNNWYVLMNNGNFFYSTDGGWDFTKTASFTGPSGHYFYGACVLASKVNSNKVYIGGSGYSGISPVYVSSDGGVTFTALNNGLTETLVHELVANDDESLLFAATDAGPFVYVAANNQWYSMLGTTAPYITYWDVEYISSKNIVRFATFGRGIWDFGISGPLPVQFSSFNAHLTPDRKVDLDWTALQESNFNTYVVERSKDGNSFEEVTKVLSSGKGTKAFNAQDPNPFMGKSYYRIKHLDDSGNPTFSPVRTIFTKDVIAVFPNPLKSGASLSIHPNTPNPWEIALYSLDGRYIGTYKIQSGKVVLNVAAGNYYYSVREENHEITSGKLVVVH